MTKTQFKLSLKMLRVLEREGFRIQQNDESLTINGRPVSEIPHTSPSLRAKYRENRKSFITDRGELNLHISENTWLTLKLSDIAANELKATDLVSPYALQILQALLLQSHQTLGLAESPHQFCRIHSLSQPRLSRMMNLFSVNKVTDLADRIRSIPLESWSEFFSSPITRRKLVSFRSIQRSYFSSPLALKILSHSDVKQRFRTWAPSALTVLSEETGYQNSVRSYWMTDHFFQKFRATSKLIPARETDGDRIEIGICKEEDFFSHAIVDDRRQNLNLIRAAWDAFAYGEREREAAKDLLRRIMSTYENRF